MSLAAFIALFAVSCGHNYLEKSDAYIENTQVLVEYDDKWENDYRSELSERLALEVENRFLELSKTHWGINRPYGLPSANEITIKKSDTVEMYVVGKCGDEIVEDGIRTAKMGDNSLVDGFEERLLGKRPGDKFSFEVIFPKDYGEYAGRLCVFQVEIKIVYRTYPFDYCDEFIYLATEYQSTKAFEKALKNELLLNDFDAILGKIVENTRFLDDVNVKEEQKDAIKYILAIRSVGESLGVYYQANGDFDEYKQAVLLEFIKKF